MYTVLNLFSDRYLGIQMGIEEIRHVSNVRFRLGSKRFHMSCPGDNPDCFFAVINLLEAGSDCSSKSSGVVHRN